MVQQKNYEQASWCLSPIRVVVYDEDEKFLYDDRYYGWDMNSDSKIDMLEKLDEENRVVSGVRL